MSFINVYMLLLIPAVIVFAAILIWSAAARRRKGIKALFGADAAADKVQLSHFKRQVRYLTLIFAMLFLILAAARPWWGEETVNSSGRGRDIVFVLDVSKSMWAEDVAPSRLAHAKYLIREIMAANPGDRFALVAFAGDAMLSCPLTNDAGSLDMMLSEVEPDSIPVGGTNVASALKLVLRAFAGAESESRAVVMISDGEELEDDASTLLAELKSRHVPLFVLGVGSSTAGAMVPVRGDSGQVSYMRDNQGNVVQTKLNEALLSRLASATGGEYFHSGSVNTNLAGLNAALRRVSAAEFENGEKPRVIERFMPFVSIAAILLLVLMMISERPYRRAAVLLCMFCLLSVWGKDAAPAAMAATGGPTVEAENTVEPVEMENWQYYQAGRAAQLADERDKARDAYEAALQNTSGARQELVQLYSYHNLGVLEHETARDAMTKAKQNVRGQQLDGALKELDSAEKRLDRAEELYLNAMHNAGSGQINPATPEVQQQLLLDRAEAGQLRKQIEELKKQQEEAKKQIDQAQQQNQQDQQDQQNQQDQQGKQDQQNSGKQSGRNNAQQSTEAAKQAAEKLADQAEQLGQQELKQQAEQAAKELDEAKSQQDKGDYQKAGEHLQNALNQLNRKPSQGDEQKKQNEAGDKKTPESGEDENGGSDQKNMEQPKPEPGTDDANGTAGTQDNGEKIDGNMADQMLDRLNQDERDLRNRLNRHGESAPSRVGKDW